VHAKPVIPHAQANRDVDDAIAYYLSEAGEPMAMGFVDALEKAYGQIGRHPATGSPRYAHELHLPGLRIWPLTRYLHLVFYVEHSDHIDVWRVLYAQQDTRRGCKSLTPCDGRIARAYRRSRRCKQEAASVRTITTVKAGHRP
jgi:toxin ParE1/3/4